MMKMTDYMYVSHIRAPYHRLSIFNIMGDKLLLNFGAKF